MGTTKDERERRLAVVEQVIHERGWSMRIEQQLADRFGVCTRTVRRYRADVEDVMRQELRAERADIRAGLITRLRGHQMAALRAGRFGPLASMIALEARMLGCLEPQQAAEPGVTFTIVPPPEQC